MPALLTAVALLCFAGNSILCRLALAEGAIDATTFTLIRLASGAATLLLIAMRRPRDLRPQSARWLSAFVLVAYALPFSFAYLRLGAAMGALILFAFVQVTMIGWGVVRGERPRPLAWLGILLAMSGLVGLTLRGRGAPDALGGLAMAGAGIAWGVYSLRGRGASGDPVVLTASSFTRGLILAAPVAIVTLRLSGFHASTRGIVLAVASGTLASGLGYSFWYAALRHLTATRAAVLQLLVPIIAAVAAVPLLGESITTRLVIASVTILGGVALTIRARAA